MTMDIEKLKAAIIASNSERKIKRVASVDKQIRGNVDFYCAMRVCGVMYSEIAKTINEEFKLGSNKEFSREPHTERSVRNLMNKWIADSQHDIKKIEALVIEVDRSKVHLVKKMFERVKQASPPSAVTPAKGTGPVLGPVMAKPAVVTPVVPGQAVKAVVPAVGAKAAGVGGPVVLPGTAPKAFTSPPVTGKAA